MSNIIKFDFIKKKVYNLICKKNKCNINIFYKFRFTQHLKHPVSVQFMRAYFLDWDFQISKYTHLLYLLVQLEKIDAVYKSGILFYFYYFLQ